MSVKDNVSPEERLLRLIRGKVQPEIGTAVKGREQIKLLAVKSGINKKPGFHPQRLIALINIEKALLIVLVLAILYLAASLLYPFVGLKRIALPVGKAQKTNPVDESSKQPIEPFDQYKQSISGRNIFGQTSSDSPATAAIDSNLIKDISLVGILAGDNPQAIIEDKKTQKTFYVIKGQYFGEFQLEDIQEGKVILNYHGQRYELYL